jgi:type II secretory pathway pseudopilin PulG
LGQAGETAALNVTEPTQSAPEVETPSGARHEKESPIRKILIESALIVFSILLAMAVNEWADSRKQAALTERAMHAIREEITGNAQRIHDVRAYHQTLMDASKRADTLHLVHSYADFRRAAPGWSGLRNPELDATAWQSAITLGVVQNIGFDTVRALSRLYLLQTKFDQYAETSLPTFDFSDAAMPNTVRRMWVFVQTMGTLEDTLTNRYTEALRVLQPPSR